MTKVKAAHRTAVSLFNSNHTLYDQLRPSFQRPLVDKFLADLKLAENGTAKVNKKVLELAAGTGKFTKNLIREGWRDSLYIVDPSKGMLETFKENFPEISQVHEGSSYNLPMEDESIDAVVVAQGFHWFSDADSLKEISRVLKPGGKLGLIWNFDSVDRAQEPTSGGEFVAGGEQYGAPYSATIGNATILSEFPVPEGNTLEISTAITGQNQWNKHVTNYVWLFDEAVPQYRKGDWKTLLQKNRFFNPLEQESYFYYSLPIPHDKVFDFWLTRSYITSLSDEKKAEVKDKIEDLLDQYVEEKDLIPGTPVLLQRAMGAHAVVTTKAKI